MVPVRTVPQLANIPSAVPTTFVSPSTPSTVPMTIPRFDRPTALHAPYPSIVPTVSGVKRIGRVPSQSLHTQFILPTIPTPHDLRPVTFKRPRLTAPSPWPAPNVIEPDDDRTNAPTPRLPTPPWRLTRLIFPRHPGNIAIQAMHHVMRLEANNITSPSHQTGPTIDIEEYCCGVVHPITKETITQYKKLQHDPHLKDLWVPAMSKELHRLAQGKAGITKGTNTVFFMSHNEIRAIPSDRTVTYARVVIDHRPQKEDPNRVRITVGGNLINYPFELTTRTTDMVSSKILWNSTISTKGARFAGADIANMYLETPLDRYEYMRMPISLMPQDIIEHYGLREKALNGYAYMEIRKGMYGLPQAGILANKLLKKRLARHGYHEQPHTPGLWKH